jgi:hypothetical protein
MVGNVQIERLVSSLKMTCPTISEKLIRAFLFDELFMLVSRTQILWKPAFGVRVPMPLHATFFTMAPSGAGKGQIQPLMKALFGVYLKAYAEDVETGRKKHNDAMMEESKSQAKKDLGIKGKGYFEDIGEKDKARLDKHARELYQSKQANGFVKMNTQIGSVQGVAHALDCMRTLGIGSYCQRIDECASIITSTTPAIQDFITTLLSFSGGATELGRSLKAEILDLSAEGVATNIHMFGNTEGFKESPKSLTVFRRFLKQGFSRRGFFTHVTEKIKISEESLLAEVDSSHLSEWGDFFKRQYDFLKGYSGFNFDFTQDARKYIAGIHAYISNTKNDNDVERGDHTFKAQKLSCIFAMLESSLRVETRHLEEAMFYIEQSAQDYLSLLGEVEEEVLNNTDSYSVQILTALKQGNPMSKRTLSRHLSPVPRDTTDSKFEPLVAEAMKLAEEEGYFLIVERTKNGMGTQYRLEAMQTTDQAMVTYSVKAPDVPEEPKRCLAHDYEVQTTTLEELALYSSFLHVSPAIFKGGHRDSKNVEYLGNLAFFDVDNDNKSQDAMFTVEDAQSRLFGYQGVVIESMSSTVEQPRFRIVLVLDKVVKGVSKESYKQILNNIAKHLGIDGAIDKSCVETARYYAQTTREAGEGIAYSNTYGKPLEWELFLGEEVAVSRPNVYSKVTLDFSHDEVKRRFHKAVKTAIKKHWRVGTRNSLAYYLAKLGREKGIPENEIKELIRVESTNEGVPLELKELQAVITNSNRY